MNSIIKRSALGVALAISALATIAPAEAHDTYHRDNGNGYSQNCRYNNGNYNNGGRGYRDSRQDCRSDNHRHNRNHDRRDQYRNGDHDRGGDRHDDRGQRGGYGY